MDFGDVATRGLLLLGCGKMGGAMLEGWLRGGLDPAVVHVIDPQPSDWLLAQNVHLNGPLPERPAVAVIAVKPQTMDAALPGLVSLGHGDTLFLSIAAGTTIAHFEAVLGPRAPIVRAMPNTPAAIGRGITALVGNNNVAEDGLRLSEALLSAVGRTVRIEAEAQMDAVTGVSGSGPAYVFHLIECMAAAGEAEGLPAELSMQLALHTVAGAGALAERSDESPEQLRINVTSPNGTTQAALDVLMDRETGLPPLMRRAIGAAAARSRELGK